MLFKLGVIESEAGQRVRDFALRHIAGLDMIQRKITHAVSERDIAYRDSPIVDERQRPHGAPHAGDLAPDGGPALRAVLRGRRTCCSCSTTWPRPARASSCATRSTPAGSRSSCRTWSTRGGELDPDGVAHEAYGGAAAVLVRPDGYVGYVSGDAT